MNANRPGIAILSVIITVIMMLLPTACSARQGEGFTIYLTDDDVPPAEVQDVTVTELEPQPIITAADIIAYNPDTCGMMLTPEAFTRIAGLEVPVKGKTFVVCVDHSPVYWGAFWTPISSISFDGVMIEKPLSNSDINVIILALGYPASSFYNGNDPRNDSRIINSLKSASKLTVMSLDKLPDSMKGYELYSWQQKNEWHYTLITGTNRNKTVAEVTQSEDTINDDEWVNIHVIGTECLKTVLGRMPRTAYTLWLPELRDLSQQQDFNFGLPPAQVVDEIKTYISECGLDFHVAE